MQCSVAASSPVAAHGYICLSPTPLPPPPLLSQVPGAYELPFAAKCLMRSSDVDAVMCIGCLIKGETMHFEYICEAVTQGIMRLNLDGDNTPPGPVIFGVLAVLNEEQAKARAGLGEGSDKHNHGVEWAQSALHMANVREEHLRRLRPGLRFPDRTV